MEKMEEKDRIILLEATEKLINSLALFNGLCLLITNSDGIYIDSRINELLIELIDLKSELEI